MSLVYSAPTEHRIAGAKPRISSEWAAEGSEMPADAKAKPGNLIPIMLSVP